VGFDPVRVVWRPQPQGRQGQLQLVLGRRPLRHHDCDTVWRASRKCLCDTPQLDHSSYGTCATCGKSRAYGADVTEADQLLAALPVRSRIPVELRPRLEAIWNAALIARGVDPAHTVKPWR
jgi:hypothetical protein